MNNDFLWWRDGVIYQIYPRSFYDTNGDGVGDLPGIKAKLDYLEDLGVDAIWLSPFYPSPDVDFGYDVSDHCAVDPRFGNLADFDDLVAAAHQRGIKVVLDLVLNHTSTAHPWFQAARSSRNNPKRDWYLWQPKPPNNWQGFFGGPGWTPDPVTGDYYFHMFTAAQPDLNWRKAEVYRAQMEVVRFWLARGVDGFRLDVFNAYYKDAELRSNPFKFGRRAFERQHHIYDIDQPELFPLLRELRAILDERPGRYAVGETFMATGPARAASYCGPELLHAAFNFDFTLGAFNPSRFRRAIEAWDRAVGERAWPNYVLSNHDQQRSASRFCRGNDDTKAAVALALLLSLRGTPFLYYGEEIGQRDIRLARREILDPPGRRFWPFYVGRDGCRAPMQWSDSLNAGFSVERPWLPPHPDYTVRNVAQQRLDPNSLLNLTRQLIKLRRNEPALRQGGLRFLDSGQDCLAYERFTAESRLMVVLDFADTGRRLTKTRLNLMPKELTTGKPLLEAAEGRVRIIRVK